MKEEKKSISEDTKCHWITTQTFDAKAKRYETIGQKYGYMWIRGQYLPPGIGHMQRYPDDEISPEIF